MPFVDGASNGLVFQVGRAGPAVPYRLRGLIGSRVSSWVPTIGKLTGTGKETFKVQIWHRYLDESQSGYLYRGRFFGREVCARVAVRVLHAGPSSRWLAFLYVEIGCEIGCKDTVWFINQIDGGKIILLRLGSSLLWSLFGWL